MGDHIISGETLGQRGENRGQQRKFAGLQEKRLIVIEF